MGEYSPRIESRSTALVLIEFQREWLDPEGRLNGLMQDRPQFNSAARVGAEVLETVRAAGLPIFHTGLSFGAGHPELGRSDLGLRESIPRVGTFVGRSAEFASNFEPQQGEFIVKGRLGASCFAGSNLDVILRNRRIDTLLIAGFALHVCVESTLRQAHDLGYRAFVIADATAAFTADQRRHVLDNVVHHFGAVIDLAGIRAALLSSSPFSEAERLS